MSTWLTEDIELFEPIGRGGFGNVFRAKYFDTDGGTQIVAVKVIESDGDIDRQIDGHLLEAEILNRVDHPGMVRIQRIVRSGTKIVIVMDFVDGVTLKELITSNVLRQSNADMGQPCELVKHILLEIATCLDRVHKTHLPDTSSGMLHFDLSPHNIMIDTSGQVRLIDFGISGVFQSTMDNKRNLVGKTAYSAPEVLQGGPNTKESECFSLGVILLELLTGKNPLKGATAVDSGERVLRYLSDSIKESILSITDLTLRRLVSKLLGGSPSKRGNLSDVFQICNSVEPNQYQRQLAEIVARLPKSQDQVQPSNGVFGADEHTASGGIGSEKLMRDLNRRIKFDRFVTSRFVLIVFLLISFSALTVDLERSLGIWSSLAEWLVPWRFSPVDVDVQQIEIRTAGREYAAPVREVSLSDRFALDGVTCGLLLIRMSLYVGLSEGWQLHSKNSKDRESSDVFNAARRLMSWRPKIQAICGSGEVFLNGFDVFSAMLLFEKQASSAQLKSKDTYIKFLEARLRDKKMIKPVNWLSKDVKLKELYTKLIGIYADNLEKTWIVHWIEEGDVYVQQTTKAKAADGQMQYVGLTGDTDCRAAGDAIYTDVLLAAIDDGESEYPNVRAVIIPLISRIRPIGFDLSKHALIFENQEQKRDSALTDGICYYNRVRGELRQYGLWRPLEKK